MAGFEHLESPFSFGPVRLRTRAVFMAENYSLGSEQGALSDVAFDWLVEQTRYGWSMMLLGVDSFGCPTLAGLTPETFARLQRATGGVEIGLALHGDESGWTEQLEGMRAAGLRVVESSRPLPDRPDGVFAGLRVAAPELLTSSPGVDWLHLGPDPTERLALVGGTLRQPYGEELQGLPPRIELPLMFSGRVKDAVAAERVLRYYPVQMVGIGRGAVAAPELLDLARRGEDWMPCTGCMACLAPDRYPNPGCAVTPYEPLPWGESRWAIVGASVPAVQLSLELSRRGHQVALYTGGEAIGGAVRRRGRIPQGAESMEAAVYLRGALRRSKVRMETAVPATFDADHVAVSLPERLEPDPQWDVGTGWLDGLDVLSDSIQERGPFVVWGDTLLATEIAAFFGMTAREVSLLCAPDAIASDTHEAWHSYYAAWLQRKGIPVGFDHPIPANAIHVVAGRRTSPHPGVAAVQAVAPDALVIPDAYEPFAQRDALEFTFREAAARL